MTRSPTSPRRWRRRPDAERPLDPTRPHPVVRDGLPIAHEGPPGVPGRGEPVVDGVAVEDAVDDEDGER